MAHCVWRPIHMLQYYSQSTKVLYWVYQHGIYPICQVFIFSCFYNAFIFFAIFNIVEFISYFELLHKKFNQWIYPSSVACILALSLQSLDVLCGFGFSLLQGHAYANIKCVIVISPLVITPTFSIDIVHKCIPMQMGKEAIVVLQTYVQILILIHNQRWDNLFFSYQCRIIHATLISTM